MIEEVESTLDKVKDTLIAEIQSKFNEFSDKRNWMKDHLQQVGQIQKDLRELLRQSDGTLVESFSAMKSEVGVIDKSHAEVDHYQMNEEKFETRKEIKDLNRKFVAEVRKKLKLPDVENKNNEKADVKKTNPEMTPETLETLDPLSELRFKSIIGCFTNECYEVSQRAQSIVVRNYDPENMKCSSLVFAKKLESNETIVDQVFFGMKSLVIVTNDSSDTQKGNLKRAFYVGFDSDSLNLTTLWLEIPYPNVGQHVLGPWIPAISAPTHWLFWDPEAKEVRAWQKEPDPDKKIPPCQFECQVMPVNKVTGDSKIYCYFDKKSMNIFVLTHPDIRKLFTPCKHTFQENVDSISSFIHSFPRTAIIVTWSVDSKASSVYYNEIEIHGCSKSSGEWVNHARINWCTMECSIPSLFNYVLKPVNVGGNDEEMFLFLIDDTENNT